MVFMAMSSKIRIGVRGYVFRTAVREARNYRDVRVDVVLIRWMRTIEAGGARNLVSIWSLRTRGTPG